MPYFRVTKKLKTISMGHVLRGMGDCDRLHGHNWESWLTFRGGLTGGGVVVDFAKISTFNKCWEMLDHRMLKQEPSSQWDGGVGCTGSFKYHGDKIAPMWLWEQRNKEIILSPFPPTCENMAVLLFEWGQEWFSHLEGMTGNLISAKVQETDGNFAEFIGGE